MRRLVTALALVAFVGAVATLALLRKRASAVAPLLPYQAPVSALSKEEQARFAQLATATRRAEQLRAEKKEWPAPEQLGAPFVEPSVRWVLRRKGPYVNYLGVPQSAERQRWLVLIIEPEPSAISDPPPPDDEVHHRLSDGTPLHVTVWSAPNAGPAPEGVLPFPTAEGWTQRLDR